MVYFQGIQVKFIFEAHRFKVKVTGAKVVENLYSHNVKLPAAVTVVLQNIPYFFH